MWWQSWRQKEITNQEFKLPADVFLLKALVNVSVCVCAFVLVQTEQTEALCHHTESVERKELQKPSISHLIRLDMDSIRAVLL